MTQEELEKRLNKLMKQIDEVNSLYVLRVADQIKRIGRLNPTSLNRIALMADMATDIAEINRALAQALQISTAGVYRLYEKAMNDLYVDPRFERALKETPLPYEAKQRLESYVQRVSLQTAGSMQNISNTTILSKTYRSAIDRAILATSSGLTDYRSATRDVLREVGSGGIQIQYPSGYHKRLDSAIRQNILDGTRQIAHQGSMLMGEELGFDAIELSAHERSAPDHEPVQGRVFLKAEFEKMQSGESFEDIDGNRYESFKRPIGEWNCMHVPMSFSTKYSVRRFTPGQLAAFEARNQAGVTICGKHLTIYQVTQEMRKLETRIRREKDTANAARAAGDNALRMQCQQRINQYTSQYMTLAKAGNIRPRKDRMQVAGFRRMDLK